MKNGFRLSSTILLVFLLISCPLLQRDYLGHVGEDDSEIPDNGFGVLELSFGSGLGGAKTLVPPVVMEIGGYTITGTLEGGSESFTETIGVSGTFTRQDLAPGLWTITVDAVNTDIPVVTIGRGATSAQIVAGSVTEVGVTISPLPGDGTLEVRVQWSKQVFNKNERVDATLSPPPPYGTLSVSDPGTNAAFRFSIVSSTPIPAGYYLITVQLFVNDVLESTLVEAVRILADQITPGTLDFPL
jgi:hypothetical protein